MFESVAEDLEHLRNDWMDDPSDAIIRRGSVILRRLLVEGVLQRTWKSLGFPGEPTIVAPNLDLIIGPEKTPVILVLAGGAQLQTTQAAGMSIARGSSRPGGYVPPERAFEYPFKLSAFTNSPCAYVEGDAVSRREVIKYFAHYLGGVHLHLSSKVRKKEEDMVRRIRKIAGKVDAFEKDGLYYELLSIGQAVGCAPDSVRLLESIGGPAGLTSGA
jgi:hypothetical protein